MSAQSKMPKYRGPGIYVMICWGCNKKGLVYLEAALAGTEKCCDCAKDDDVKREKAAKAAGLKREELALTEKELQKILKSISNKTLNRTWQKICDKYGVDWLSVEAVPGKTNHYSALPKLQPSKK